MSRHDRPRHDLTVNALTDHVKAIADEMDVSANYLHQILSGYCADPYANFRPLYKAILRCNPAGGRALYDDVRNLYLAEVQRQGKREFAPDAGTVKRVHKEAYEAVQAAIENKTAAEQLREIDEAITELQAARFRVMEAQIDRDGEVEDAVLFDRPMPRRA